MKKGSSKSWEKQENGLFGVCRRNDALATHFRLLSSRTARFVIL
jgi:hypothetical protein